MGALQEVEIFSCLNDNLRQAADLCSRLAWDPKRGLHYLRFSKCLKAVEGAARQAHQHREDSRWLRIAWDVAEAKKRAGRWVRSLRTKEERARAQRLFEKLAENLRQLQWEAEEQRTKATGKLGMILPRPLEGPHRDTRPVQIILPSGGRVH